MSDVGIVGCAVHVPLLRLRRSAIVAANAWVNSALKGLGKGERAIAAWDEDVVTMAVDAGRTALTSLGSYGSIASLTLASTSAPFADRSNAGLVAGALNIGQDVLTLDVGGTLRAGVSALIAAARMSLDQDQLAIVAAADVRNAKPGSVQEMQNGDGAAAIVLGRDGVIARIVATHTLARDFVDHFRASDSRYDYGWEERWVRDEGYGKIVPAAVAALLRKSNVAPGDIDHFVLPSPLAGIAGTLAKRLKLPDTAPADGLAASLGFTGAAHGLVMLTEVLERAQPGERILVAGFGNGCDALLLETTDAIADWRPARPLAAQLAQGQPSEDYVRFLSARGEIQMDWGPRAEFGNKYALTAEYRTAQDNLAFIAGRDRQTGVVQFPKTPMGVAEGATGVADYEDVPLAEVPARLVSFTADWLTYYPSPPLYFGLVQFENGARVMMEIVEVGGRELKVGDPLRMVFRIKEIDRGRGYRHYFWKAAPALETEQ